MGRRISQAAVKPGDATDKALVELGLSAQKLNDIARGDQFLIIAEQFEKVANQGDKMRLAMALFDTEGVGLVNTMDGGARALAQYQEKAKSLGLVIDDLTADSFENMNDAVMEMKGALSSTLIPALTDAAKDVESLADAVTSLKNISNQLVGDFGFETPEFLKGDGFAASIGRNIGKRLNPFNGFGLRDNIRGFSKAVGEVDKLVSPKGPKKAGKGLPDAGLDGGGPQGPVSLRDEISSVVGSGLEAGIGSLAGAGGLFAKLGVMIGDGAAPALIAAEQMVGQAKKISEAQGPRALEGAAAIDQARRNRAARTMQDPKLKVQNAIKVAAEKTTDAVVELTRVVEDKLTSGTELARK